MECDDGPRGNQQANNKDIILPPKVWDTLDAKQQTLVVQTIVNLCQQMIEVRKQEENE